MNLYLPLLAFHIDSGTGSVDIFKLKHTVAKDGDGDIYATRVSLLALAPALACSHFSLLSSCTTGCVFQAHHNQIVDWPQVAIISKV